VNSAVERVQCDPTHRVQYDHTPGRARSPDGSAEYVSVRNRPKTVEVWTIRLGRAVGELAVSVSKVCSLPAVKCYRQADVRNTYA
jgi:hypothetical protein